jgi:hypothetical protein
VEGHRGFGPRLAQLLKYQGLSVESLSARAELTAEQVRAAVVGRALAERFLRRLAPVLGLRAADLFVLAGLAVPDDLAPLDSEAKRWVSDLVSDAVHLPSGGRQELLRLVGSLPHQAPASRFVPQFPAHHTDGPGALILRMLAYRNLTWSGIARTMAAVTPTHLAASTYAGAIRNGRLEVTPRLVTDFAALLGIHAPALATLTGIPLPEPALPPTQQATDTAALLWQARRQSAAQAQHVSELARTMHRSLHDRAGGPARPGAPRHTTRSA